MVLVQKGIVVLAAIMVLTACAPARAITTPTAGPADEASYRLIPGELVLAATPDDNQAIFADETLFVNADAGDAEWDLNEPVVGLTINGENRAYPIRLLSLHEVVNDNVGGQPIAVTWCPLCYTAVAFQRDVDGQELTFGVSGYLFHNNLVMYDHQSNTLWSQLLMQGLRGAYRGHSLKIVGIIHTTWGAWQSEHPDTLILSAREMGSSSAEIIDPYVGYYTSGAAGLGQSQFDPRLPAKTLVIGVQHGEDQTAYPFEAIRSSALVEDQVGGLPILLGYLENFNTVVVYSRLIGDATLTFQKTEENLVVDQETASVWDLSTGEAIDGQFQGEKLSRLHAPMVFWFAWSDLYDDTGLYVP